MSEGVSSYMLNMLIVYDSKSSPRWIKPTLLIGIIFLVVVLLGFYLNTPHTQRIESNNKLYTLAITTPSFFSLSKLEYRVTLTDNRTRQTQTVYTKTEFTDFGFQETSIECIKTVWSRNSRRFGLYVRRGGDGTIAAMMSDAKAFEILPNGQLLPLQIKPAFRESDMREEFQRVLEQHTTN